MIVFPPLKQSHESLLKHHLQVVTEERGRLAETTVELGEKTERLMYELADAREAARARDEVISLLQIQLQRLEESQIKGLEEVQTHRFHLDSRDQELRHLEEVCQKVPMEILCAIVSFCYVLFIEHYFCLQEFPCIISTQSFVLIC